jgi:hypothetical protein
MILGLWFTCVGLAGLVFLLQVFGSRFIVWYTDREMSKIDGLLDQIDGDGPPRKGV